MADLREMFQTLKRIVIRKSRDYKKIAELNEEINGYNQDMDDVLVEIGEYIIRNDLLKDDSNIQEWMEQLIVLRDKVEDKRDKILEIKNVSICSRCGAEYPRNSRKCSKCGNENVILLEQR